METRPRELFKEWLEKLQQESWQLELLISGLALFGIWEARGFVVSVLEFIEVTHFDLAPLRAGMDLFGFTLDFGWMIFFVNLLIHVFARALWIGAIGLRYLSSDIDYQKLDYEARFVRFFK